MAATIIIENGTVVSGANSYVTTSELSTYADERGVSISAAEPEDLLIKAMDYLESLNFKGVKYTRNQALQWPRADVYIDGYYVNADTIPIELKEAEMQIALSIDAGYSPDAIIDRKTKREKVDELEIEYTDGSASNPIDPKINRKLKKLLKSGPGIFEVVKG